MKMGNAPTYPLSLSFSKHHALPSLPALAVRPHRCENCFGSVGGSNWITTSTAGRSRPRAATSVHNKIDGELAVDGCDAKAERVEVRRAGGMWP